MEVEINIEEIQEFLPHRYPMLLVDRVTHMVLGESITAYKNITTNEPFFMGHFPGKQVMPGVLIVEAMGQASGILGFKTMDKRPEDGSIYYFVGADDLRFKRPATFKTRDTVALAFESYHICLHKCVCVETPRVA